MLAVRKFSKSYSVFPSDQNECSFNQRINSDPFLEQNISEQNIAEQKLNNNSQGYAKSTEFFS